MLEPISIELNKTDLQRDISMMEKDQKMINLPVFKPLRMEVERYIIDHPDLVIKDMKFEQDDELARQDVVRAIISFKVID